MSASRDHCRRKNAVILLPLLVLLLVTDATLVARDFHHASFDRDCPACLVSSTFMAEEPCQPELTRLIVLGWNAPPEDILHGHQPSTQAPSTRAPPA